MSYLHYIYMAHAFPLRCIIITLLLWASKTNYPCQEYKHYYRNGV